MSDIVEPTSSDLDTDGSSTQSGASDVAAGQKRPYGLPLPFGWSQKIADRMGIHPRTVTQRWDRKDETVALCVMDALREVEYDLIHEVIAHHEQLRESTIAHVEDAAGRTLLIRSLDSIVIPFAFRGESWCLEIIPENTGRVDRDARIITSHPDQISMHLVLALTNSENLYRIVNHDLFLFELLRENDALAYYFFRDSHVRAKVKRENQAQQVQTSAKVNINNSEG